MIERFRKELQLSDSQTEQLIRILDKTIRQYHDLHSFTEHMREEGIREILEMLDPVQRERFDEILKQSGKLRKSAND